jgi:hypothetical protein
VQIAAALEIRCRHIDLLQGLACVGREQALEDAGPTQAEVRLSPHALAARTRPSLSITAASSRCAERDAALVEQLR